MKHIKSAVLFCSNTYADSLAWQLNISHVTSFHIEINLLQDAEEIFISDIMSRCIYTDMASDVHIKINL